MLTLLGLLYENFGPEMIILMWDCGVMETLLFSQLLTHYQLNSKYKGEGTLQA